MSEVALLRRQIEVECEAMKRGLEGFSMVASHEIINHRFNTIGNIQERLATIIGKQQAEIIAIEVYIQTIG